MRNKRSVPYPRLSSEISHVYRSVPPHEVTEIVDPYVYIGAETIRVEHQGSDSVGGDLYTVRVVLRGFSRDGD